MREQSQRAKPSPMVGIFLTVFIDMLGFGLFLPDLQLRGQSMARQFLGNVASAQHVQLFTGIAISCFSAAQLIAAPLLGRLSDRIGRRPILLLSTLLSAVAYVVYAHVESYGWVVASRIISGIAAANLGVAFAYIADITPAKDRAQGLGKIGFAFGLGFIFGPPLGSFLLRLSHDKPTWLGYAGAVLAAINFAYILLFLGESVTKENADEARNRNAHIFSDIALAFRTPSLGLMLVMFFALTLGFTNLESTFFQLLSAPRGIFQLGDHAKTVGALLLTFVGLVTGVMQGLVVRRAVKKYGELRILRYSYFGYVAALATVPFAPLWVPMLLALLVLAVSSGLSQPSLSSLISRNAPREIQGGIFGVTQALGALARCVGPLVSNPLFGIKPEYPYLLGAALILFPALAAWRLKPAEGG